LKLASALVTIPERWAAISAAPTAAAKKQRRGRERPHPPMATVAPRSLRGVAHALLSLSRVATAAKRFACRIRVGFTQGVAPLRSGESCPDPYPDRPAERHRSISVTRTQEAGIEWPAGAAPNGRVASPEPAITHSIVERHAIKPRRCRADPFGLRA
jgi:hypothetical protein